MKIPMCGFCNYCYSNETMGGLYICTNGESENLGEFRSSIFDEACENYEGPSPEELEDGEEAAADE